jgi:hypothetical protein
MNGIRRLTIAGLVSSLGVVAGSLIAPPAVSAQGQCYDNACEWDLFEGWDCEYISGSNQNCVLEPPDGQCEDTECKKPT